MPFDANDPETKAALEAYAESATAGLKAKVNELIADNKALKKGREIDPAEIDRLERRIDELTVKLTDAEKRAKDAGKAAETAAKALEAESGFTRKLLVENNLKDTLIKGGVKDEDFLDALVTKFSQGAAVIADGDVRKAMLGDKPLSDVVGAYLASDAGKKFVAAPVNGGGGANGGGGDVKGKTMTRAAYSAMDQNAKAEAGALMAKGELRLIDEAA